MSTPDISRPCHLQPISKTMIDSNSSCRMLAAFWYCSDKSNPIGHSTIRVCWWDLRLWHLIQFDCTLYLLDSNLLAWNFGYANQGTFTATDLEIHLQFPWCVLICPKPCHLHSLWVLLLFSPAKVWLSWSQVTKIRHLASQPLFLVHSSSLSLTAWLLRSAIRCLRRRKREDESEVRVHFKT